MTVMIKPTNIRGHKLLLSVEVSEGWMKKKTCSDIFRVSCAPVCEDLGREKVSLGFPMFCQGQVGLSRSPVYLF